MQPLVFIHKIFKKIHFFLSHYFHLWKKEQKKKFDKIFIVIREAKQIQIVQLLTQWYHCWDFTVVDWRKKRTQKKRDFWLFKILRIFCTFSNIVFANFFYCTRWYMLFFFSPPFSQSLHHNSIYFIVIRVYICWSCISSCCCCPKPNKNRFLSEQVLY